MTIDDKKQKLIGTINEWDEIPKFFELLISNEEFLNIFLKQDIQKLKNLSKEQQSKFTDYIISLLDYTNDSLLSDLDILLLDTNRSSLNDSQWFELDRRLLSILKSPMRSLDLISKKLRMTLSHNNLLKTLITASKNTRLIIFQQLINRLTRGVDAISVIKKDGKFIDVSDNEVASEDVAEYLKNALLYEANDEDYLREHYPDTDFSKRLKLEHPNIEYKNIAIDSFTLHQILKSFINVSEHIRSKQPPYSLVTIDFSIKHETLNSLTFETQDEDTLEELQELLLIKAQIFMNLYTFALKYIPRNKGQRYDILLKKEDWYGFCLVELANNGKFDVMRGNLPIFRTEHTSFIGIAKRMYKISNEKLRYVLIQYFLSIDSTLTKAYANIKNDFKEVYKRTTSRIKKATMMDDFNQFTNIHDGLVKRYFDIIANNGQIVSKEDLDMISNPNVSYIVKNQLLNPDHYQMYFQLKQDILNKSLGYDKLYDSEDIEQNIQEIISNDEQTEQLEQTEAQIDAPKLKRK